MYIYTYAVSHRSCLNDRMSDEELVQMRDSFSMTKWTLTISSHIGVLSNFPRFQKLPDSEFGDIPVPHTHVSSLKKAANVLFTSTYGSLIWTFRHLMSYAILGNS